jgi:hypothetical protein
MFFTNLSMADSASPTDMNRDLESAQLTLESEDELISDRPDYTESSEVVRPGWMQMESGLALERSRSEGTRTLSVGNPLMRIGVSRRLELRFGSEGIISERSSHGEAHNALGRGDLDTGVKLSLRNESRHMPAISFIGAVSLPTGNAGFGHDGYDPTVKLIWSKSAPAGFVTAGNFNWSTFTADHSRVHQRAATLSLGHDLPGGFKGSWEVYALTAEAAGEGWTTVAATGIGHRVGHDAQWDISVERRLAANGPDWTVGAGVTFRHPIGLVSRFTHH